MPLSWTKTYEEEGTLFPAPHHEGEAMLQLSSSLSPLEPPSSSPVLARPPKQYILGPLTHEASSSSSPLDSPIPTPDLPFPSSSHPRSQRTTISSVKSFASSPLNPTSPIGPTAPSSFPSSPFNRSGSRASTHINRIASEESRALASHQSSTRGSMILYHITTRDALQPPTPSHLHRNSILSVSGDSIVSLSSDSKYPARTIGSERGLIAYAYDPSLDELGSASPAEDDYLHEPDEKSPRQSQLLPVISLRGVINVLALLALILALLCLFVVYPVIRFYHDNTRNVLITFNARVNSTGQVSDYAVHRRSQMFFVDPILLIDQSTPLHARVLQTAQDIAYGLVFSDEFTQSGRSFSADHDPIWEVPSSSTSDIYYPSTKGGSLLVTLQGRHQRRYKCVGNQAPESGWRNREQDQSGTSTDRCSSGILKMKIPLCLSSGGMVEVGLGNTDFGLGFGSGLKRRAGAKTGKGQEGEGRRLIYWPDSSDSWSSFNQSENPNIPADVLTSDSDSGSFLALSFGIPMDDLGETSLLATGSDSWGRVEVDYVRIYQPIKSLPLAVAREAECASAQNDVVLDLLEGM